MSHRALAALVMSIMLTACTDGSRITNPNTEQSDTSSAALKARLVVSGVVTRSAPPPETSGLLGARLEALAEPVSYVSLVPGTIMDGVSVTLTNTRTQASATAPIVNGGFDPEPVPATGGDKISVVVSRTGGPSASAIVVIDPDAPPRVVRTNPPRGQSDVPVNTNVMIVFSEPVDPASIGSTTITLRRGVLPVAGTAQVQPGVGYVVEFEPATPLATSAEYTLTVQPTVTNLAGKPLGGALITTFTTALTVSPLEFASLSVGNIHTCGLTAAGKAYCWGYNGAGQLGDGSTTARHVPVAVVGGLRFASVSAGINHSCGITTTGAAYCWGFNSSGQLGTGTFDDSLVPIPVASSLSFASISANGLTTCAITTAGDAYCWGWRVQLAGVADHCPQQGCATPVQVSGSEKFASVSVGSRTTCGLGVSGTAYCWGYNEAGELGNGSAAGPELCEQPATGGYIGSTEGGISCSRTPVAVSGGLSFTSVVSGNSFSCGLIASGEAYCWGTNDHSEFGNGTWSLQNPTPVVAAPGLRFRVLSPGNLRTCGIALDGNTYCWGLNSHGEADAVPSPGHVKTPNLVPGGWSFTTVGSGYALACALNEEGHAYCWGANWFGSLGNNSLIDSFMPVAVRAP